MHSTNHLMFGPLPQTTYEAAAANHQITVDIAPTSSSLSTSTSALSSINGFSRLSSVSSNSLIGRSSLFGSSVHHGTSSSMTGNSSCLTGSTTSSISSVGGNRSIVGCVLNNAVTNKHLDGLVGSNVIGSGSLIGNSNSSNTNTNNSSAVIGSSLSCVQLQHHHRSGSLRWDHTGVSTSAEHKLPLVHRFREMPPPAGPPSRFFYQSKPTPDASRMSSYESNPVGTLQERFTQKGIIPVYTLIHSGGVSHCPIFTFQVSIEEMCATGSGNSKKQAKHAAARAMLCKLDGRESDLSPSSLFMPSLAHLSLDGNSVSMSTAVVPAVAAGAAATADTTAAGATNCIGLLQEFCVKNGLPIPVYEFNHQERTHHQRTFCMVARVGLVTTSGEGSSKKEAKRKAAEQMLQRLMDAGSKLKSIVMMDSSDRSRMIEHSSASPSTALSLRGCGGSTLALQSISSLTSSKLNALKELPLKRDLDFDFKRFLIELSQEQKFDVVFLESEDETTTNEDFRHECMVRMHTFPVAVCSGFGKNKIEANNQAARCALCYLKIVVTGKAMLTSSNNHEEQSEAK